MKRENGLRSWSGVRWRCRQPVLRSKTVQPGAASSFRNVGDVTALVVENGGMIWVIQARGSGLWSMTSLARHDVLGT